MVVEYENERHIREQKMAAKFAEDVAATIRSNQKEDTPKQTKQRLQPGRGGQGLF